MADVNLEYGSTGFEKVNGELKNVEQSAQHVSSAFKPVQATLESVASSGGSAFSRFASGAREATGSLWEFITGLTKVTAIVSVVNGLLAGAGVYAFGRWSEGMLKATESSRVLEATMRSVLGSEEAFQKVSLFAKGAAAGSQTTTYSQIMETAKRFSLLPGTKPIYEEGNTEWMERVEGVVSGLARMFPNEGRQGAEEMVQGALAGQWRRFQMATGRRPEQLAQGIGVGKEEMEYSSLNIIKGIESVTQFAPKITTIDGLLNKLRGSYHQWLEDIGNTGIYDKALGFLKRINEAFSKLFSGQPGAWGDFQKIATDAAETLRGIWEKYKEPISEAIKGAVKFSSSALATVTEEFFLPVGLSMAKALGKGLRDGLKDLWHDISMGRAPEVPGQGNIIEGMPYKIPKEWRRERAEEAGPGYFEPGPGAWSTLAPQAKSLLSPPQVTLEHRAAMVGSWAGMAGKIAEATGAETSGEQHDTLLRERRIMRDKWTEGAISDEEWRPFAKQSGKAEDRLLAVGGFQRDYMGKMQGLVSDKGATPAFQAQMYQQMQGISLQRGDISGAGDYMQKSLDALAQSFKNEEQKTAEELAVLNKIEANTRPEKKSETQPGAASSPTEKPANSPAGRDVWSPDELQYQVQHAMGDEY